MKRRFRDLSAAEVLALAISLEEEDGRILGEFARLLRNDYPRAAAGLDRMRAEEDGHRRRLIALFKEKFGEEIPLVRPQDIRGFVRRDPLPVWRPMGVAEVRKRVAVMELETERSIEAASEPGCIGPGLREPVTARGKSPRASPGA